MSIGEQVLVNWGCLRRGEEMMAMLPSWFHSQGIAGQILHCKGDFGQKEDIDQRYF